MPDGNRLILGTSSNNLLDFQNSIDLSGSVRAIQGDGGLITGHARLSGILSGTGGINQVGNGFLELTGANTYTGGTVMSSGTLVVGSNANLGNASGTLTFNGGTLENTSAMTTARSVTINALGGTFRTDANLEASGAIAGAGQLTKIGAATLSLTGNNIYLGGTTINAGTLQIGNGGTAGSILGNVIDNGVLAFNRSDALIHAGAISGAGSLEQRGAGTTILTGHNTYFGGTTISAGTLQIGNGGTIGSIAGNVANGGVLAFNRSDAHTFGGIVSGSGSLEQRGSGTLTLTATNTYAGGTVLTGGTLAVASDGNLGGATGPLVFNGGTFQNTAAFGTGRSVVLAAGGGTFLTDADLVVSGQIGGIGTLAKQGAATLTLTGEDTYIGGTMISAGTLQIGNGGTSGSIMGGVANNGVLAFNRSDALTFGGIISGAGSLEQRSSGTLMLTGNSAAFAGNTSVLAGTLMVNGILGGTLDVFSGARLQGIGTVGVINVASGATLAPGAPFGVLTVAGNVNFAPGSTFEIRSDPSGTMSLLHAIGTATIGGGTVRVFTEGGLFQTGRRYTILTADAGRSGVFSEFTETYPLLDMTLGYDLNNVYFDVARNSTTLCTLTVTRNQCAVSSVDTFLGADNQIVMAVRNLPDVPSIQRALDLLSGEIYASTKGVMFENSRFIRDAVSDRVRQAFDATRPAGPFAMDQAVQVNPDAGRGVWVRIFGTSGNQNGDGNAARVGKTISGLFVGADTAINDNLRLGIAAGHSQSGFNVNERTSSASSDDYHLAVYGGTQWGPFGLRFGTAYTWHDIQTNRSIVFPGFADATKAAYDARTAQVFGETGYALTFADLKLEPFARLAQVSLSTDSFNENGGLAALRGSKDSGDVTYTLVGLHAVQALAVSNNSVATVHTTLGWRRAFGDVLPLSTLAVGNSPSFAIAGIPIAKDALFIDAGIDVQIAKQATVGVYYNGQIARDAKDNGLHANFNWKF